MDSTARLVGSDTPHVDLAFQRLPTSQYDMQEDNPIPGHFEPMMRPDFLRFTEDGSDARV
jgi:hypothetical protein